MTTPVKGDIKLSIIIPVYNTEQYLPRCLDSVLLAIKKIDCAEIIVVNDGSKGNTDEIIETYLQKYSNVLRYFRKENAGLADTKNFGLEKSVRKIYYIC